MITALAAGVDGALWLSTPDGLGCLDGGQMQHYLLPEGLAGTGVLRTVVDHTGGLWLSIGNTDGRIGGGLVHFDGETWTTYTRADGLPGDRLIPLQVDAKGRVWVTGEGRLYFRNGCDWKGWEGPQPFEQVTSLVVDRQERLWLAARSMAHEEAGLVCVEGDALQWIGPAHGVDDTEVTSLYEDAQGRLWVGSRTQLYYTPDPMQLAFVGFPLPSGWPRSLTEDAQGQIWLSSYPHGLYRCDGQQLTGVTTADGLPVDAVLAVTADASGRLWAGSCRLTAPPGRKCCPRKDWAATVIAMAGPSSGPMMGSCG